MALVCAIPNCVCTTVPDDSDGTRSSHASSYAIPIAAATSPRPSLPLRLLLESRMHFLKLQFGSLTKHALEFSHDRRGKHCSDVAVMLVIAIFPHTEFLLLLPWSAA
mmetsp:Transcript_72716/g.115110  ORF Transcript_72716/g.115110 Transcript_72716/m.115110 type:complete len:107 (+) Transcript_72716:979-1299(+)